jgi:hypothetical protein
LVLGIACLLFGVFCLYMFGRVTTLTCTHVEPTQVNCHQQESWAGLIPLGSDRTIYNVQEAKADRRRSSNPSPHEFSSYSHHVILRTADGVATAIECFGFPQAKRMAKHINAFIANSGEHSLGINNFSLLSTSLGIGCVVLPCAILSSFALGGYFGGKRKEQTWQNSDSQNQP